MADDTRANVTIENRPIINELKYFTLTNTFSQEPASMETLFL